MYNKNHSYKYNEQINNQNIDNSEYICNYKIDFELHYFIPSLQSDLRSDK
jgi:hypothetical protein